MLQACILPNFAFIWCFVRLNMFLVLFIHNLVKIAGKRVWFCAPHSGHQPSAPQICPELWHHMAWAFKAVLCRLTFSWVILRTYPKIQSVPKLRFHPIANRIPGGNCRLDNFLVNPLIMFFQRKSGMIHLLLGDKINHITTMWVTWMLPSSHLEEN